jgi:hypothetical protein
MSVFDESGRPENYLETLVGEGKKFQTPEDLAKGKWESDQYISTMKQELEDAKAELAARKRVEELLKEQRQTSNPPAANVETHQPATDTAKVFTAEDFDRRVREIADERDSQMRTANNVNSVSAKLIEIYGSQENAAKAVAQRARELEVPVATLQAVAAQSPKAFFAQLGVQDQVGTAGPTHGDINTAALGGSSKARPEDRYSWYQEVRKTNPTLYRSADFQMKMHEAAGRIGEGFFDT